MSSTIEVSAYIGEFEEKSTGQGRDAISADAVFYGRNEALEYFHYNHAYIPLEGKFSVAMFDISYTISKFAQNTMTKVESDTSIAEFTTDFRDEWDGDYLAFDLYDDETRTGYGSIHKNKLPDEFDFQKNSYYITVILNYDHEYTKERKSWSDSDIEQRRIQAKNKFEDVFNLDYSWTNQAGDTMS